MLQLISLLRTYISQLQQQLALKGVAGAPIVLGVATSTATSTEPAETPKKRRGGGGGGGRGSSSQNATGGNGGKGRVVITYPKPVNQFRAASLS